MLETVCFLIDFDGRSNEEHQLFSPQPDNRLEISFFCHVACQTCCYSSVNMLNVL
uniref:Uncharacterized protein n=1 Tax=Rhizophora mucronata TaxID=61149 RepID=A0A2P2QZ06_RHIMU